MAIDPEKCCVIIAAYNEAENIEKVLNDLIKTNFKIVVVDDGSADNTVKLIDDSKVYLLQHQLNCGQGAALQTGIEFARKNLQIEVFVTMDADGQHQIKDIAPLIEPIVEKKVDVVLVQDS